MMKWFLSILAVLVFTLCLGVQATPEDMRIERRVETTSESSKDAEQLTGNFTARDLVAVYDYIGMNFMLVDQTDLPEDIGLEKGKRISPSKQCSLQDIVLKSHHAVCQNAFCEFLSVKHIQGFYVYWINKLII